MKNNILILSLTLLFISCNKLPENKAVVEKSYIEALKKAIDDCHQSKSTTKEIKVEKEKKTLIGQFEAFKVNSENQINVSSNSYTIEIENFLEPGWSDPNKYKPRNFLNEGDEWKFNGILNKALLIVNGNNSTDTKRISGAIELINNSYDSLSVELVIRDNTKRTVKSKDLIQEIKEIWVRKN